MKFSVFADLHHAPGKFPGGTFEDLDLIEKRAIDAGASFIIHAGDFCHGPSTIPDYVEKYNNLSIPTYHVLGNHDAETTPYEEVLKYFNMPSNYYFFDCEGYRFIALDTNYYLLDGKYVNYSMWQQGASGGELDHVPPEQLKWLEKTIDSSPYPCVLISHHSFEREADGVRNQNDVRTIINNANKKRAHSVLLCINGHYHRDHIRILDGVCYLDLNSASFDWLSKPHDNFPKEMTDKVYYMRNTLIYNDPIHAIIELSGTTITIDGMESSLFMGIGREHTVNPLCDAAGRPVYPRVSSAKITL